MLVDMAIGDAYGAAFEFIKPARAADLQMVNDVSRYYPHPDLPIGRGRFTDDTQMAKAIARALLEGSDFSPLDLATRFLSEFKNDPRPGYSSGFFNLLDACFDGQELLDHLKPGSTRSGAAMRVAPLGLLHSTDQIMMLARAQAQVTHDSPEGIESAQAIALATHYLAYGVGPKATLGSYVASFVGAQWADVWEGYVSVEGIPCARAAIQAVISSDSQREILRNAVSFGGDVDTVAAMAMFMASVSYEVAKDLPEELYRELEDGNSSRIADLKTLDDGLLNLAREQGAPL